MKKLENSPPPCDRCLITRRKGNVYLFKRECFSRHTTSVSTLVTPRNSPIKHSNLAVVNHSSKAPNMHKHIWAVPWNMTRTWLAYMIKILVVVLTWNGYSVSKGKGFGRNRGANIKLVPQTYIDAIDAPYKVLHFDAYARKISYILLSSINPIISSTTRCN